MSGSVARLARAIGYPEEIPADAVSYALKVDGRSVVAHERDGLLTLTGTLAEDPDEATLVRFAGYAAGRILREEAVLAWDPQSSSLMLWQGVSAASSEAVLTRFFEVFATSCDWWFARLDEEKAASAVPEMVIRP